MGVDGAVIDKEEDKKDDKQDDKKDDKEKEKAPANKHSFFKLFSFATKLDVFMIMIAMVASAAAGLTMLMFVVLFGNSVDSFNNPDPEKLYDRVVELASLMAILGAVAFCVHAISRICWSYTAERQIERMRVKFLQSILRQDMSYFDTTGTGALTSQMVSNTSRMQEAIGEKLGLLVQYLSTFIGGNVIGFIYDWRLTLVVLSSLPLLLAVGGAISMIFTQAEANSQKAYSSAGTVANEFIGGMRTVQSFNLQQMALRKYLDKVSGAMHIGIKKGFYAGASIGASYFVFFGWYALTFWYGGSLLINGKVSGGDILIVIMAVMIASFMLGIGAANMETVMGGYGASSSFFDILERVPIIDNSSISGLSLEKYEGNLRLSNVQFRYPSRPEQKILDGVNLNIPAGAKVALVGPSGSGKSSIIQLLQRFYDPEDGSVSLDGHDLKDLNVGWLRSQFGIVGQEPALFSGTIGDNIAFGCHDNVSMQEIERASRAALAHDFIQTFPLGYDTQVGERGAQLSGGQKQRIAIARAILKNPKILLLDEATSALDSRSEKKVQKALDNASEGRTTIVVAHRLSTIKNADIIAVLDKGRLIEQGTHTELIAAAGVYANLVRIQVGAHKTEDNEQEKATEEADEDKVNVVVQSNVEVEAEALKKKFSMKQVLRMSRPEYKQLFLGSLGSAAIGVINPVQSIFFAEIFVGYYLPANEVIDHIMPYLLIYVGLAIAMQIAYIVQGYFFGYAGQKLVFRCREASFRSILSQEIGWFDAKENSTGILTGKLATEATQVEAAVGQPLGAAITCLSAIITGFAVAYAYAYKLAWVIMLVFPFILFGGVIEIYSSQATNSEKQYALLSANVVATEAISNIRTVASYCNEDKMLQRYSLELLKPKEQGIKHSIKLGLFVGIGQFCVLGSNALSFWYGGRLIRDQEINFSDFMMAFSACMFASESVSVTLGLSSNFTKARSAATEIFALINRVSKINSLSEEGRMVDPKSVTGEITFENVQFAYPTRPNTQVLRGLDLVIKPNQVTALVGASGCGKSSCIGLIQRWYDPLQGSVKLDGIDLREYNIHWLRKVIGIVGQEPVLFSGTIADNIGQSIDGFASLDDIENASKSANAHNFISLFPDGYRTQVGEKGAQLSGGQKQRIAIARAIIKKPSLLLLDEATSALDTESEQVVQEALDSVMQGLTTIVIAHRLSTIRRANHIAVIDQGVVVEQGTHEELMAMRNHYFRLVEAQT